MTWLRWLRWVRDLLGWFQHGNAESLAQAVQNVCAEGRKLNLSETHPCLLAIDSCAAEIERLRDLTRSRPC